ncbi:5'-AMP-activated protein kinase subunit gamma-1 [Elysia marginata]|uniref:5'-AMP-activated protein kinase subunit gamma-1 n=1 Tax=Elysia marginata TaxID=1093978 RepID=A0AAV4I559_9GAST|nr:5'-AMP-activated protein kinase subunit gamma-1 [Elysia marginata]
MSKKRKLSLRLRIPSVSPLKLQSGEPRSAPPNFQRASSLSNSEHTHAMLHRMSVDSDRMEIEDLDENEDQIYSKFMRAHRCYDLIPTSAKLVIFDTQLNVKKAFFALVYNGVRAAPLWDSVKQDYVGMLTITDFINILKRYYKSPDLKELPKPLFMDKPLRDLGIGTFKNVITATAETPLIEALNMFVEHRISALPVVDDSGQVTSIYAKFDVINLAADKSYNNLDITLGEAIKQRQGGEQSDRVATCFCKDTVRCVMEKIVKAEVHRLVVTDELNAIEGIVSLSDILNYIVLRPICKSICEHDPLAGLRFHSSHLANGD